MTEREYNECVNLYADNVYRFILKNLRTEEDAKDIVQSSFEKLWKNKETVENAKSKSFLFTVAYNQMIDHIRKNKRINLRDDFNENIKVGYQQHSTITGLNSSQVKVYLHRARLTLRDYLVRPENVM
jgi:RNA polymerase sigma-70 factor (ECF subfamily)